LTAFSARWQASGGGSGALEPRQEALEYKKEEPNPDARRGQESHGESEHGPPTSLPLGSPGQISRLARHVRNPSSPLCSRKIERKPAKWKVFGGAPPLPA